MEAVVSSNAWPRPPVGWGRDCLIFNFVATNTAEGRVLQKLFDRIDEIEADLTPIEPGRFSTYSAKFPSNLLERMLRDMYVRVIERSRSS